MYILRDVYRLILQEGVLGSQTTTEINMSSSSQRGISYCSRKGREEFPDSLQRRVDNDFGKWRESISKLSEQPTGSVFKI